MIECKKWGGRWTKRKYEELRPIDASIGWCPEWCGEDGDCVELVEVSRELLEEIRDWLSQPQTTGGRFPMETHRAEAEGVDHLLSGLVEALNGGE